MSTSRRRLIDVFSSLTPNARSDTNDVDKASRLTFNRPWDRRGLGNARGRNMRSRYRCSMCPAIHINSRSWLRSSSTHEPSDPPFRVIWLSFSKRSRQASAKNDSKVIKIKNVKNESRQKLGRSNSVDSLNLAQIALIDGKGVTGDKGTLQICLSHKIRFGRSQRSTIL